MRFFSFFKRELNSIIIGSAAFLIALLFDLLGGDGLYWYAFAIYIIAFLVSATSVFLDAIRGILRKDLFDEKFLMCIASLGAMVIGDMTEGVAVMLFFRVGEYFEHRAVQKSRNSIKSLMNIMPDEACVIRDGEEIIVDAEDVEVGSEIIIRTGERIPIDSAVVFGTADVDTSALTGESLPCSVGVGDTLHSGCVVKGGLVRAVTLRPAEESAAARVLALVENASERKAKEEKFITKFSRIYTPTVVLLALLMAFLPPIISEEQTFSYSVYSALTFLVISCPCALVISVPMAFFGGIGGAASKGIMFKGGNIFAPLARIDSVAFDKTGTLTSGSFSVKSIKCYGISEEELMFYAASAEYGSNHPFSKSIREYADNPTSPDEYKEIAGRGVVAVVLGHSVLLGNSALLSEYNVKYDTVVTGTILVAIDGVLKGEIFLEDDVKTEADKTILKLKNFGVKRIAMLSGDKKEAANAVGERVGISEIYAELLPEQKFSYLESIIASSRATLYVGDGINDAPSLARADVGVAMGGIGTDSAIESADVVIMSDSLEKIPLAMRIARKTVGIAKINIIFALGVKAIILLLGAFGMANMWLAVFADVGVAVLAILNSMRTLRIKE